MLKLAEITHWQRNLATLIRSGLLDRAEIVEVQGLFTIIGVHDDGSRSAPLAKYADRRRAEDALNLVQHLNAPGLPGAVDRTATATEAEAEAEAAADIVCVV